MSVLFASSASAETLGDHGTTAVSGAAQATSLSGAGGYKQQMYGGTLALDRFVAPNVSVGVGVGADSLLFQDVSDGRVNRTTGRGLRGALRAGYLFPLSDRAALWPVAHLGVGGRWMRTSNADDTMHTRVLSGGVQLVVTYAISEHLYLRGTPFGFEVESMTTEGSSARRISAGLNGLVSFGLGGWF